MFYLKLGGEVIIKELHMMGAREGNDRKEQLEQIRIFVYVCGFSLLLKNSFNAFYLVIRVSSAHIARSMDCKI